MQNIYYIDIHKFYHSSDIFIFSSTCETLPLALLEAMKSSLPILCSKYIYDFNITPKKTLYYDPLDPEDIAKKIKMMVADVELRKQSCLESYIIAKKYNWKTTSIETFNLLYQQCIKYENK